MDQATFEGFRRLIYERSGIVLGQEKVTLLSNRIQRRLRELKLSEARCYLEIVETDLSGKELIALLDAVSTNTTHFYREAKHFLVLQQILKEWSAQAARGSIFKIWCAASSSGEEPYCLAFESLQALEGSGCGVKILATDISTKVLNKAVTGSYSSVEIEKIPPGIRDRFMQRSGGAGEGIWTVIPQARSLITFKKLNLVEFPYPLKGPIDVIFCRNVMIYFDTLTRQKIVDEFSRLIRPGGYLFLSLSENLLGINHSLQKHDVSVFRR